ncbi:MAG: ADP-ribose pyrophosphatase [Bacteroidetes bacterium]|nr:MAG: ADP-ribose pyrophosphatase [Bacteroidota bacterium]PTM11570.1 MAG: ADP-ribose pyrophosphatase [Bacteroidota bacterium]
MQRWQKVTQRYAFRGWRSMLIKTFRLPDGSVRDYDILENGAYVVVAAFTTGREAILVRQFRPGPERFVSSFCEGYIDSGESPGQAAARELLEETGYRAGSISYLRTIHSAYTTEDRICLLATDCEFVGMTKGDDDEFLAVSTLPLADFLEMVAQDASNFSSLDAAFLALRALGW